MDEKKNETPSWLQPIDIQLDKPRKLLINSMALRKAEFELNRLRGSDVRSWESIDGLIFQAYGKVYNTTGRLPADLLFCLLWGGLLHEDPKLQLDDVGQLLDRSPLNLSEISGIIWRAYWAYSSKGLQKPEESKPDGEESKN
jgi:hypothetical protein